MNHLSGACLWPLELIPGFSLYNGLYELSQYAMEGRYRGTSGMAWSNLADKRNGMKATLTIMTMEWLVMLVVSYYVEQVVSFGNGVTGYSFFCIGNSWKMSKQIERRSSKKRSSIVRVDMENFDVSKEVSNWFINAF